MTEAQYVKTVAGRRVQDPGPRRPWRRAAAKLKADDFVAPRHLHHRARLPAVLLQPRQVYRLRAHRDPERERTAKGMPIVNLLPLQPGETIQAIIDTRDFAGERFLFFATRKGTVKKTAFDEYDSSLRDGLIAINLRDGDELVRVIETSGGDDIFMVSRKRHDDPLQRGRRAPDGPRRRRRARHEAAAPATRSCRVDVARDDTAILIVTEAGYGKRTQLDQLQRQGRGGQGVHRHQAHRQEGPGRRRVHGRPRRRDRRRVVGRRRRSAWRCARSPRRAATPPACG